VAVFPGTFDPLTLGHLDLIERASSLFEALEVTVAVNDSKSNLLPVAERAELIRGATAHLGNVSVGSFEGLVVDHARMRGAGVLVRGLRQASDFEYEIRMAFANGQMAPDIETVFLMTSADRAFISSTLVREIYRWGGDISPFVPGVVSEFLKSRR
jgi:pantetheine-phosphate adenylyltransferase